MPDPSSAPVTIIPMFRSHRLEMITAVSLRAAQDCANTAHTARIFAITIRPSVPVLPISEVSKIEEGKMATNSMITLDK